MIIHLKNIKELLTLAPVLEKGGKHLSPSDLGLIQGACIICDSEKILWVGKEEDFDKKQFKINKTIDCSKFVITPEIVDAHTHLVFAGDRSDEYVKRLNGEDYQKIANSGGGILKTMRLTLEASETELLKIAKERVKKIASYGVGTIEIKTGYALNYEGELKLSRVVEKLKKYFSPKIKIINTFMAAHAVPMQYESSQDYLQQIVIPLLKHLKEENAVDIVDIFHEQGYFSTDDVNELFDLAKSLEIPVKMHADEFNDNGGAELAIKHHALSADHLLKSNPDALKQMAHSSTVAVLLPGTALYLGKPFANSKTMSEAGVQIAIGSDYNPGSCHWDNVLKIAMMCSPHLKLNITQLWAAITYNGACALGIKDQGIITEGFKARLSFFEVDSMEKIIYNWGDNYFASSLAELISN